MCHACHATVALCRAPELYETIKGELLQPGGVRALERMGLGSAAKCPEVDPVRVDGYVVLTSATAPSEPGIPRALYLPYPSSDPASMGEFFGVRVREEEGGTSAGGVAMAATAGAWAGLVTGGTVTTSASEATVCAVTGTDVAPRGRSFHNVRFVQQLRLLARAEPNVTVMWGSVRRVVTAEEFRTDAGLQATWRSAHGKSAEEVTSAVAAAWTMDPARVVGIVWRDKPAAPDRLVLAPLTVVADGMFSTLR